MTFLIKLNTLKSEWHIDPLKNNDIFIKFNTLKSEWHIDPLKNNDIFDKVQYNKVRTAAVL